MTSLCPVCGKWLNEDDLAAEINGRWLGRVHPACETEASVTYEEWLNDMREDEAALANRKERDL